MRAIQLIGFGAPDEVIKINDIDEPAAPSDGEVLIQVEYAPLDHHDLLLARGTYPVRPELPAVIGNEGAGRVLAVGPAVTHVKAGDRVVVPFGTYSWAERVLAPADAVTAIDPRITAQQAAMLRINPITAGLLLDSTDLPSGSWVVQNAANSGVGRSVIAYAKERGLATLNIVRREELVGELLALGADAVLVASADVAEKARTVVGDAPVLLALDGVSGGGTSPLVEILTDGGSLISYAHMSGEPFAPSETDLRAKNLTAQAFWMYQPHLLPKHPGFAAEAERLVIEGKLELPYSAVYSMEDFPEALAYLQQRGKVLLDFSQDRA
ncbi:zinc-dependent alcohol dehydrogenase family protein [Streptomyces sp. NPDC059215]|uniref:zinc-dependent alcohol dehydrogenase family protein n=1 Tax=Streptomyces sp. NPDC059215 TaxID=3346772 RepID=UPI00369A7CA2